jgi:hypothetical protein
MKKLLLTLSIVSLFLSCNNGGMENTEIKEKEQEEGEFIPVSPVTNIRHTKNGDVYTVFFDYEGVDFYQFHATVICKAVGQESDQKNYDILDKAAREYRFNYAEIEAGSPCPHTPKCREIRVHILTVPNYSEKMQTYYMTLPGIYPTARHVIELD